eukprot:1507392-Prymnesium_polylepis.1
MEEVDEGRPVQPVPGGGEKEYKAKVKMWEGSPYFKPRIEHEVLKSNNDVRDGNFREGTDVHRS